MRTRSTLVLAALLLPGPLWGARAVRLVLEGAGAEDGVTVDGVTDDARESSPAVAPAPGPVPQAPEEEAFAPARDERSIAVAPALAAVAGAGPDSSGQQASDLTLTPLAAAPLERSPGLSDGATPPGSPPGAAAVTAPAGTFFALPGAVAAEQALGPTGGGMGAEALDGAVGPGALPGASGGNGPFTGGSVGPGALPAR